MALIHDLQAELLNEDKSVGFVLLKLKFLASKLGVDVLDDWVQHEIEGYPSDIPVPDYRETAITYTGTFVDIARQLNNVSIPGYLIEKHAGDKWTKHEIRSSLSLIDQQMKEKGDGKFGIDASNLPLLLQDKIYEGMAIIDITSNIDIGSFLNIQHTVRARALDFALRLEKEIPSVAGIEIGGKETNVSAAEIATVTHLTQQIIHGGVTNISATGDKIALQVSVAKGDAAGLVRALISEGLPVAEAHELAAIVEAEQPDNRADPMGSGAKNWLQDKLKKGAAEAWNMGKPVVQKLITEAIMQYYGL
ncbi:hypothetical protein [uncultured Tateyamaria sp.]|uniref:AbiTii domain-containing protein n=1 Tax=uncultured Tateyamaria sp. TaxID=455651 RepID=UPI00261024AD|nr:hypothetical protein [uncultured Tateyamaria sp.]